MHTQICKYINTFVNVDIDIFGSIFAPSPKNKTATTQMGQYIGCLFTYDLQRFCCVRSAGVLADLSVHHCLYSFHAPRWRYSTASTIDVFQGAKHIPFCKNLFHSFFH